MPTLECPGCGDLHYQSDFDDSPPTGRDSGSTGDLDASLVSWSRGDPRHPYPAETSLDQTEIDRLIQRVVATVEVNGDPIDVELFRKPASVSTFWTHVVRATTDAGRKSKNAIATDDGHLFVKNRGTPWNSDKQWTYLSKPQLATRSRMADLGRVLHLPETSGGLGILLDEHDRGLVVDGQLQEELLLTLVRMLLVMQSGSKPVG